MDSNSETSMGLLFLIRKITITSAFVFIIIHYTAAQSLDRQLFSSAGNASVQVSYSIGEPLTNTFTTSATLTQGFHQPLLPTVHVVETPEASTIAIIPNPAGDFINIRYGHTLASVRVSVFDIRNSLAGEFRDVPNGGTIPISPLPQGLYFILFTHPDNETQLGWRRFIKM